MASKRMLYHPAPQKNVGQRKTRKPLAQGRLINNNITSHTSAQLVQGQLSETDPMTDPTLSPLRAVPVVTEKMSPRPEPPSRCLDLSDVDLDLTGGSSSQQQQTVMVLDASHLACSPNSTEVDVVVAYEDSPARVICHTPGKLGHTMHSGMSHSSPRASGNDGPVRHWTVAVDQVPKIVASPKSSKASKNLFLQQSLKEKEDGGGDKGQGGSSDRGERLFSQQGRGIIEEILAQEIGSENYDAISLHSHGSALSPQQGAHRSPQGSKSGNVQFTPSPVAQQIRAQTSALKSSVYSPNRKEAAESESISNSSVSPSSKKTDRNVNFNMESVGRYPQPKFDEDSDTSTDRVPVRESLPARQAFLVSEDNSGSDTCSLYEYVTPRKQEPQKSSNEDPVKVAPAKKSQNAPGSTRKKKPGRVVQSRYMQSSTVNKSGQSSSLSRSSKDYSALAKLTQDKKSASQVAKSGERLSKPAAIGKAGVNKNKSTLVHAVPKKQQQLVSHSGSDVRVESPHTLVQTQELSDSSQSKMGGKTSTPTHDHSHTFHDIDASAIQSISQLSVMDASSSSVLNNKGISFVGGDQSEAVRNTLKAAVGKSDTNMKPSSGEISQKTLDLKYSRYLQAMFLSAKMKKVMADQEKQAVAQLQGLWQLVEAKRRQVAQQAMEISRLKRINLVESLLGKVESQLESVVKVLPQLEGDYSKMSMALDTTRHQLPTRGIHVPRSTADDQEAYEERVELTLRESERLLDQLSTLTQEKSEPLGKYLTSLEAIDRNVTATEDQLDKCQQHLDTVQELSTKLASLRVQSLQSHM